MGSKAQKSQTNPADGEGERYAGRDRNNKFDHSTAHWSCSASMTVAGLPDKELQGHTNNCRSGSRPFRVSALSDVFDLWRPSVFTSTLRRRGSREAAGSASQACSDALTSIIFLSVRS
jgi:hypothetical protein